MIHHKLVALLKTSAPKVYPNKAPEGAVAPFLVYTRVSTPREVALDGPTGLAHATYRVDVYHSTYDAACILADALRRSLDGYSQDEIQYIGLEQELDLSDLDPADPLYRINQEYRISHDEQV